MSAPREKHGRRQGGGDVVRGAGTSSGGRGRRQGGGDVVRGAGTSSGGQGRHSDVTNCYNLLAE